jgi:CelD/BcsL family acetyltransferase involved in cellulose biosynthesis
MMSSNLVERRGGKSMFVDQISGQNKIDLLRQRWDQLYESDGEAHFFLSWAFISTYMRRFEGAGFVLAARAGPEGSPYVAFLPLRLRTRLDKRTGRVHNEINMAGNYAADYTGILCAPEYAKRAIAAFGKHLRTMNWAKLHLENLRMSEQRLRFFLNALVDDRITIVKQRRVNDVDGTDNTICPYIDLPDSWDRYLSEHLSSNTRQKLRRLLRTVEGSDEFRITVADASTVKRDVDILLNFWRTKWSARKGQRLPTLLKSNRMLFNSAVAADVFSLAILWHRDRPLGALAFFVDKVKRTMLFHMAGRDETSDLIPSGLVLHAYCIRKAIEMGFRGYDFLRGNEPYKYSFATGETTINCYLAQTKSGRNLNRQIDAKSVGSVFRQATEFHKGGDLIRAEAVYRQVLEADPAHTLSLYGLGQLLSAKGDHRQAAKSFEIATAGSNAAKIWMRLGAEYQALDRHDDALGAFRKVLATDPGLALAQYGLSQSLIQLSRLDEAAATIATMRRSPPGSKGASLAVRAQQQLDRKRKNAQPSKTSQPRPVVKLANRLVASTALPAPPAQKWEATRPPPLLKSTASRPQPRAH